MGLLSIKEMIEIIKKNFQRIVALSILIGALTYLVASSMQTYTCVLGFKFNNSGAEDGLALDGESKLDPYEIQNPVVIQGALDKLGYTSKKVNVKGIRQNITVSKVVTGLDSEVSKSAALLGEKYEAPATEFEMKLKYKKSLGETFGTKMFGAIIKEYDKFLIDKYYNKNTVTDFAKIVVDSSADYIDIADIMGNKIDEISKYLYDLSEDYPEFRSKDTGYSFDEVAALYDNLKSIQHAKYYGNIRAGNLAKDRDMVIKSYTTKIKDLEENKRVNQSVSENYKASITTFYDSYKAAGLYRQAENVQRNTDSSNNRDKEVLYDFDVEKNKNTYDEIVINYVDNAVASTDALHTIDYYKKIVDSYQNDKVDKKTKDRLLKENEKVLEEINLLSAKYSTIANETIDELYNEKVTGDLQYLIAPEANTDIPVLLITIFAVILVFGLAIIFLLISSFVREFMKQQEVNEEYDSEESVSKKVIDTSDMDELHTILYDQYLNDFSEFYLVYQVMKGKDESSESHMEAFMRWKNAQIGLVSPAKIVDAIHDLGLFDALNDWIFENACKDIAKIASKRGYYPVVHINCPKSALSGFAINDTMINYINKYKIPAECICLEINGEDISGMLEEIMLIKDMGIAVCIDRFEDSDEDNEIIGAVKPDYIKMSVEVLNYDMYATSAEDYRTSALDAASYILNTVTKCHEKGIKVCVCGIENKEQDDSISKLFDYKQGFYYGKPEKLRY